VYKPLPHNKRYIRLLRLSPLPEELKVTLEVFPILSLPPYEALSYAWGKDAFSESLEIDSGTMALTPHLFEGVRQLRASLGCTTLWIDAICINQADSKEKEGQIPLMAEIYSQAKRVVVWLGAEADGSDHAMTGIPVLSDPSWSRLANLVQRPWFRRLWVVQEVVLAK
ncbi:HET-domain-containing protein, partial [Tothia fuscella]